MIREQYTNAPFMVERSTFAVEEKKKKWAETRIATHVNAANADPNCRFETKNVYQNKTKKKVKKCKNI